MLRNGMMYFKTYKPAKTWYESRINDKDLLNAIYTTYTEDWRKGYYIKSGHRYDFEIEFDKCGEYYTVFCRKERKY